jgi:cytochrome P450
MPFLDAVIKESMRLYPVAPFIVRKLTTDVTIPDASDKTKNTSLPASTLACIWIYSLHRQPSLWNKPDEFLPERWIESELRSKDRGQQEHGAYMPFAIGPRNCLGQPLAHVILRIFLARIINKYTVLDPRFEALKTLKGDEVDERCLRKDMQAGFTVLPSNGLKLQLVERM